MTTAPAKAAYGTKHICSDVNCLTKFYDMQKENSACPKCGRVVVIAKPRVKTPRSRSRS